MGFHQKLPKTYQQTICIRFENQDLAPLMSLLNF